MSRGYKEEINWKEISQDKIQLLKHKPVKFSSFLYLAILNIATIAAFAIIFTSYQEQHPYSLDEIASLTDSLAYEWYNETTEQDIDLSTQAQTTTQSSTQSEIAIDDDVTIEETVEETTQDFSESTVSETSVQDEIIEETTNTEETQTSEQETTTQTTTAATTTIATTLAPLSSSLAADTLVYVTSSGSKFHYITCSYLSNSCTSLSYSQAISSGYSPCSRCFPNG